MLVPQYQNIYLSVQTWLQINTPNNFYLYFLSTKLYTYQFSTLTCRTEFLWNWILVQTLVGTISVVLFGQLVQTNAAQLLTSLVNVAGTGSYRADYKKKEPLLNIDRGS